MRARSAASAVPALREGSRIGLIGDAAAHHLGPVGRIGHAGHFHGQREAVEELRAQVAFLRVHRADQDELAGC